MPLDAELPQWEWTGPDADGDFTVTLRCAGEYGAWAFDARGKTIQQTLANLGAALAGILTGDPA